MVEKGAEPQIPTIVRRALQAARAFSTPLMPDAYLELINPLWSTRELKGRIVEIRRETHDTATIVIAPNLKWPGHEAGQYIRLGVEINGIRHWRAFTLTSDPGHPRGHVALTVKKVEGGLMSTYLLEQAQPGDMLFLGQVEGEFGIHERPSRPILLISAGSGVTPMFALLRHLERRGWLRDVVHVFGVRTPDDVIFARYLTGLAESTSEYALHTWFSTDKGRLTPSDLAEIVPDWRERTTYLSGPPSMIDTFKQHWTDEGLADRFELERFQPKAGADVEAGEGGTVRFRVSETEVECDGSTPILEAGEEAGLTLQHGCRMGICHTCVGRLAEGKLHDLLTGNTYGEVGEMVRICVSAPEGHVEIDL